MPRRCFSSDASRCRCRRESRQPLGRARFLAARRRNADQVAQQRDRIAVKSFRVHVRMSFHDRVFLRSASGAKAGVLLCFLLRFRGARARCRLELFSLRVCHVILIGRCQRFALSLFCFCFCFSLPLCVMPALYKSFAICFALFSARAVSAGRSPFRACRMADFVSRAGLSVLFSLFFVLFPCAEARFVQVRPQPAVPRLSFVPFPAGSVPDFGYAVIRCRPKNEILSGFETVRFGVARKASRHRTGGCWERGFFRRDRPAMRRTGLSLPLAYGLEQHDGRCS